MNKHAEKWRKYYEQALQHPHHPRTELAITLNQSNSRVAVDCGCGVGSDLTYLAAQGFQVHGFDINQDAIEISQQRLGSQALVDISQSTFEQFDYPQTAIMIANSSLYFADPALFKNTWNKIVTAIEVGGVFAGDFLGPKDSWANDYQREATALDETAVKAMFNGFDIVRFSERDELGTTAIGASKHWHTYSVVAIKTAQI